MDYKKFLYISLVEAAKATYQTIAKRQKVLSGLDIFNSRSSYFNSKDSTNLDILKQIIRPKDRAGLFSTDLRRQLFGIDSPFYEYGSGKAHNELRWKEFFESLLITERWADICSLNMTYRHYGLPSLEYAFNKLGRTDFSEKEFEEMVKKAAEEGWNLASKETFNPNDSIQILSDIEKEMERLVSEITKINEEGEKIIDGLATVKEDLEKPIELPH